MSESPQLVDDSNPAVQYVPGWIWETLVNEVDGTRHGAAETGLSATLAFVGTGIQVIGTLQRSSGQPSATFTIDGEGNTTYAAPAYTSSADAVYNVTLHSRRDLKSGNHELKITNMNGTGQNVLWLDYFLIDSSPPTSESAGTSQTSTSGSSASTSSTSSPSASAQAISSQSTKGANTGAIVGGVVGGVALIAALGLLLFWLRRRRRKQVNEKGMQPFTTRPSLDGSGYPNPSKSSYRPSSVDVESPFAHIATTTTGNAPASAHGASRVTVSDNPADDSSALSYATPAISYAGPSLASTSPVSAPMSPALASSRLAPSSIDPGPPSEPLRSPATTPTRPRTDSKSSAPGSSSARSPASVSTPPTSPSPSGPLPTDIGQALAEASPELQSTALTLIRSLLQRNRSQDLRTEVDSGLRIYDEANMMPPPGYTED